MKKFMISALVVCSLLTSSVMAFAMDSRITASNAYKTITSYGGVYASGYTTSTTNHYTSVQISSNFGEIRTSDRNWGTGTIWSYTDSLEYDSSASYYYAVYYGF